ncbi:MAG: ATP-binding protein [Gammaproteobacteria bacterium]|nr:ATP-binding protein [Gammaproteobacteria bacterium]
MYSGKDKYKRLLVLDLPEKQSAFLWGARKTGKSTYLKKCFPNSIYYDLLKSELLLRYLKQPNLFREEILALSEQELQYPIIVDEVQKVPLLLNEIHWLIENTEAYFILCGSSARKLKKGAANLLGGRAWKYNFYPLVYPEITDFDLLKTFNVGLIPSHYLTSNPRKAIKAYIEDYLTEEIKAEGLTRNLPSFARFLDIMVFSNGELVNYNNIARDCGVDAKTVKSYYEILVDTLIGYFVPPFSKKNKRDAIAAIPKFYLFDVGIANHLAHRQINVLKGPEAGHSLEHYILMELTGYRGINDLDFPINFWRTKQGLEVDFILGDAEIAIEVKINDNVNKEDLKGLCRFTDEYKPQQSLVVSLDTRKRKIQTPAGNFITIMPYLEFLQALWDKKIIM